jgi:hypothetical protein
VQEELGEGGEGVLVGIVHVIGRRRQMYSTCFFFIKKYTWWISNHSEYVVSKHIGLGRL